MTLLPILMRELRTESRRPWAYWARSAAGAIVVVSVAVTTLSQSSTSITGQRLLNDASQLVIALTWGIAPLLTSDCLSREKREGTLGLLFLTPVTPAGIVLGKSLVHGLRVVGVSLAALPVMAMGLLFGGVSGQAILLLGMHQLGVLCLALAAGLLASAWSTEWMRSVLLTVILTGLFALFYYSGMAALPGRPAVLGAAFLFSLTLLLLALVIFVAARRIRDTWQESAPSRVTRWLAQVFCAPRFWKQHFRALMRQSMERNPVGWLHERTTTARLSKWMWCLGAVVLSCFQVGSGRPLGPYVGFEVALLLAMAFAGAASFRRERQNGSLELLLVTPLSLDQVVRGRLGALRKQFVPAVAMLAGSLLLLLMWVGDPMLLSSRGSLVLPLAVLLVTSVSVLPKLGLFFSLRGERFLTAWALTCLVGLAAPILLAGLLTSPNSSLGFAPFIQLGLGHWLVESAGPPRDRASIVRRG